MARGEEGLQVLRNHVVEHRLAGIPGCVGGHGWCHTSPHGQQGEDGRTRRCSQIYCSNVQHTSKKLTSGCEETSSLHCLAAAVTLRCPRGGSGNRSKMTSTPPAFVIPMSCGWWRCRAGIRWEKPTTACAGITASWRAFRGRWLRG